MTGKSVLLQKIREMNRTGDKYPNKYTDTPHSVLGNEAEELKKKPRQPESTCSAESQNKQTSHVQFEDRNPKTEVPPRTQQSAIKKTKQQRYYFFSLFTRHITEQWAHILTMTMLLLVTNRDNNISRHYNMNGTSKFLSNWQYIVQPNLSIRSSQQLKELMFFMIR